MTSHESTYSKLGKGRTAAIIAGVPVLAATAAIVGGRLANDDGPKMIGAIPAVESCGPEVRNIETIDNIRRAVARQACGTAVNIAANVVNSISPAGMYATTESQAPGTTFGQPSYIFTQELQGVANPIATQSYSVAFERTADGEVNMSNILRVAANNGSEAAVIDHYTEGDKDVYVGGFADEHESSSHLTFNASTPAFAERDQDASNAAVRVFQPEQ